jgi:hypothetical protein
MVEQLNLPAGEVAVRANGVNVSENQAPLDHQYSEKTMQDLHQDESRPSQVRVAFADGELSFTLSKDATFEDLADQLRDLDERPHGKPVTIEAKLAFARCPATSPPLGAWSRYRHRRPKGETLNSSIGRPVSAI